MGPEVGERGADDGTGARGEPELVLGPAHPFGLPTGAQWEDPVGVLHDPLAAGSLLDDGHHGVVLEAHRCVDPEEAAGRVGDPDARRLRLAHRTHPPRAIAGPPPPVGGECQLAVADLERAGPRAHLGEPGRVEGDPGELAVEVPGLEMGLGEAVVDGVELDAPLVGLDDDPNSFETL